MKNIIFFATLLSLVFLSFKSDPPVKNISQHDIFAIEENGQELSEMLKAVDQVKAAGVPIDNILVGLVSNYIDEPKAAEEYAMELKKIASSAMEGPFHITEEIKNNLVEEYGSNSANLLLNSHKAYMELLDNTMDNDEWLKFWKNEFDALLLNKSLSRNESIVLANIYKNKQIYITYKYTNSLFFNCNTASNTSRLICERQAEQVRMSILGNVNPSLCGVFSNINSSTAAICAVVNRANIAAINAFNNCCFGNNQSFPVSTPKPRADCNETNTANCRTAGGTITTSSCSGITIFTTRCNGRTLRCCR